MQISRIILSVMVLLSIPCWSLPEPGDIGLGFSVGSLGALQAKVFLTKSDAMDVGAEFLDHPWAVFFTDYTRHFRFAFGAKNRFGKETTPYLGIGIGGGFWDRLATCGRWNCQWNESTTGTGNGVFVRLPMGIEWFTKAWPVGVTAEITPSYLIYPSRRIIIDGSIGARYYF